MQRLQSYFLLHRSLRGLTEANLFLLYERFIDLFKTSFIIRMLSLAISSNSAIKIHG